MTFKEGSSELQTLHRKLRRESDSAKKVDLLLDALSYSDAGLELIAQCVKDSSREVRQSALFLLSENDSNRYNQAKWEHLPFIKMECLHTIEELEYISSRKSEWQIDFSKESVNKFLQNAIYQMQNFNISNHKDLLICHWDYSDRQCYTETWHLLSGKLKASGNFPGHELGLAKADQEIVAAHQDRLFVLDIDSLKWVQKDGKIKGILIPTPRQYVFATSPTQEPLIAIGYNHIQERRNYLEIEIRNYETNVTDLYFKWQGNQSRGAYWRVNTRSSRRKASFNLNRIFYIFNGFASF